MSTSLISSTSLVQVPGIIVTIGNYTFGKYIEKNGIAQFPNYIDSLEITKINGEVNTYRLTLNYGITENDDPNYFEKVFASVALTRKITFTYGDQSLPNFMYRQEEAIITGITSSFSMDTAKITYNVNAVSQASLGLTGCYSFPARYNVKPSDVIYEILGQNEKYGLQDLFTGMRNLSLCREKELIMQNDLKVNLQGKTNVSVLDYLQWLVDNMRSTPGEGIMKNSFYIMKFSDDITDTFGGTYFQVVEVNSSQEHPEAYELDIGYPNANCVYNFNVENNENYAIYYTYETELHPQQYVRRINARGEFEDVYAPTISSKNPQHMTQEADRSWWTKVSEYPIKASIQIKGLLRPAVLMSYVRLKVLFYGRKHINSGLYVVSKQVDVVNGQGCSTTLNLIKIAGDEADIL